MCRHFADWPSDPIHLAEVRNLGNRSLGLLNSAFIVRMKQNLVENAKRFPLVKINETDVVS
jgi:hypothetical protein